MKTPVAKLAATAMVVLLMINLPICSKAQVTSCSTVNGNLYPCLGYVRNGAPVPDYRSQCCQGMRNLLSAARGRSDRQKVCSCLVSYAGSLNDDQIRNAAKLPGICGVDVPYTVSRKTDCSRVN